ncbi:outer membrane beta-barrel protein [Fluviicola sp.]|uniref:outer membrane beta-barrel protein n=1 Tax=Fluviicola sp. TaxID=1917219 RepID=UPI0031D625F0
MKKITLIGALILGTTVYGQKGSWYLGGSAGASMGNTTNGGLSQKRATWNVSPEVGTFLTDHIQLGFGIGYAGSSVSNKDQTKTKSYGLGGSIHSRYLFGKNNFKPFLGIGVSYNAGRSSTATYWGPENGYIVFPNDSYNQQTLNASLTAGFFYDLSPRFSVFGSMNVLGYNEMHYGGSVFRDLGFNASTLASRFSIGLYYTFKKGKSAE